MIQQFNSADTKVLFAGKSSPRFVNIRTVAERKLQMLHRVVSTDDLRVPPQNRLEKMKGKRKATWSIRINDHWRLCFRFEDGHAFEVEIVDYH